MVIHKWKKSNPHAATLSGLLLYRLERDFLARLRLTARRKASASSV